MEKSRFIGHVQNKVKNMNPNEGAALTMECDTLFEFLSHRVTQLEAYLANGELTVTEVNKQIDDYLKDFEDKYPVAVILFQQALLEVLQYHSPKPFKVNGE